MLKTYFDTLTVGDILTLTARAGSGRQPRFRL
jgi:hypothetical protein